MILSPALVLDTGKAYNQHVFFVVISTEDIFF